MEEEENKKCIDCIFYSKCSEDIFYCNAWKAIFKKDMAEDCILFIKK